MSKSFGAIGLVIAAITIIALVLFGSYYDKLGPEKTVEVSEPAVVSNFFIDVDSLKSVKVITVIDGDTFIIAPPDSLSKLLGSGEETMKCRLIGIDTPESVATGENEYKNCPEGKKASDYLKGLIEGKEVKIEFDSSLFDKYGRLLVYAYTENGVMINKNLLENGYARCMEIAPNNKYSNEFKELETNAKNQKQGFWALDESPWVE